MRCPSCDGSLEVTHTYQAGGSAQTRDYKCVSCGRKHTSVTFFVDREEVGAAARLARELEANKKPLETLTPQGAPMHVRSKPVA